MDNHIPPKDKWSFLQAGLTANYLLKSLIHSVKLVPVFHPGHFLTLEEPVAIGLEIVARYCSDKVGINCLSNELTCPFNELRVFENLIIINQHRDLRIKYMGQEQA